MTRLAMPWTQDQRLYSSRGRLVLKLPLGEMPDWIPTARDVQTGALPPATRLDHSSIDRVLKHFGGVRATRVHGAAASRHQFGSRHHNYTDLEHVCGLSRTLRIDLGRDAAVSDAIDALRQLSDVERVSAHYLTMQPFAAPATDVDVDEAWHAHDMVNASDALAYEPGDAAVIIAIVDTGISLSHRELEGRLRAGFDTVQLGEHDVAAGVTLVGDEKDEDPDPDDEVGHGTACAGIIGARGDEIPPGLAGDCSVLP
ncbi:MAG TPA: S8 family serine peptidase, partial [Gemmatimonadaceae bacterium]